MDKKILRSSPPGISPPEIFQMLLSIGGVIFVVEGLIMLMLPVFISEKLQGFEGLIDATILALVASLIIYFLLKRGLISWDKKQQKLYPADKGLKRLSWASITVLFIIGISFLLVATHITFTLEQIIKDTPSLEVLIKPVENILLSFGLFLAGLLVAMEVIVFVPVRKLINKLFFKMNKASEENRRFANALERSINGVIITDTTGYIKWVNSGFCRITKYSRDEVLGKRPGELLKSKDLNESEKLEDAECRERIRQAIKKQRAFKETLINQTKHGKRFYVVIDVQPMYDTDRNFTGFISINTDITQNILHQKELQEKVGEIESLNNKLQQEVKKNKELAQKAESANVAKSRFLANMSHEIRTPMNGVIGMLELLKDSDLDYSQKEYVDLIEASGKALLDIINDILDFSKIEAGKLTLEYIDFNFRETVRNATELLALQAYTRGLELIVRIAPEIPHFIKGDPTRIKQIITNIIGNSIKFTEKGYIILDVSGASVGSEDTIELFFSISDTGIGISKEKQASLFKPFDQLDNSTTRKFGGSGLGLSITRLLIKKMNGRITVESEPGKGTTFNFSIRLKPAKQLNDPIKTRPVFQARALIVDPHPVNRLLLEELLHDWGMSVSSYPELSVVPYEMYNNDSLKKIAIINEEEWKTKRSGSPLSGKDNQYTLIISTTNQNLAITGNAGEMFANAFLRKPIHPLTLCQTLNQIFNNDAPESVYEDEANTRVRHYNYKGRVLLAEDNPVNQKVSSFLLNKYGLSVDIAENGLEAVQKVKQTSYDMIFMDIQMPVLGGVEATQKIKKLFPSSHTPIIALTAYALTSDKEKFLKAGLDDYLTKPIVEERLSRILSKWLK